MRSSMHVLQVGLVVVLCVGCERTKEPGRTLASPNVVVITVDTLRSDRLGCYGFEPARTPNIDRLAAEGIRVDHAISPTPLTLPTHTSIFTGLEPPAHGVRDNGAYHVPDEVETLAERLKAEGYKTQAFVSAMVLHRRYKLDQGFDGYDDELWSENDPVAFQFRERSSKRTTNRVLEWLGSHFGTPSENTPFFLWIHFFDPHAPYNPPVPASELAASPYDGEIAEVDRHVGRIVSALRQSGALDDTILVLTSDHGESLGEHGEATHGVFIYESTVSVPMIFRFPRELPGGKVYEAAVRSVDVMPTILGLANKRSHETQGVDLSKALTGVAPPPLLPQYSESLHPELGYGMAPLHGVRMGEWTYIKAPRPELYNRADDPSETRNLLLPSGDGAAVEAAKARSEKLEERLAEVLQKSAGFGFAAPANPLDGETVEMLRALGYMGEPGTRKGLEGMDPKDGIRLHTRVEEGRRLHGTGAYAECVKVLTSVLEQLPGNTDALNTLAACELKVGNAQGAEKHYLMSLAAEPRQHLVLVQLGRLHLADGRYEEARRRFLEALQVLPGSVEAMSLMGYLHQAEGRVEEAKRWFEKAIDEDPKYPQAYLGRGDLDFQAGNCTNAKRWYDKALEVQPRNFRGSLQTGICALRLGDMKNGEAYLLRAAQIDPESWFPLYTLASARAAQGDTEGALTYLEKAVAKGFSDPTALLHDPNMASLAQDPRTEQLVRQMGTE